MLRDASPRFKDGLVPIHHIVPTISLLDAFARPFLPYGVAGRIIQNPGQQPRQAAMFVRIEGQRRARSDSSARCSNAATSGGTCGANCSIRGTGSLRILNIKRPRFDS